MFVSIPSCLCTSQFKDTLNGKFLSTNLRDIYCTLNLFVIRAIFIGFFTKIRSFLYATLRQHTQPTQRKTPRPVLTTQQKKSLRSISSLQAYPLKIIMRVGWGGIIFSPEGEGMYLHHLEKVSLRDKRQFIQALKALFFFEAPCLLRSVVQVNAFLFFQLRSWEIQRQH